MFIHDPLGTILSVYVDDFKLSGPIKNLAEGWQLIREHLDTEDPKRMETVLYVLAEVIRNIAILTLPFMPSSSEKI